MPRRPPIIFRQLTVFTIAKKLHGELKKVGEELARVVIRPAKGHCFDIYIHTRSVCRTLRCPVQRAMTRSVPVPVPADDDEEAEP